MLIVLPFIITGCLTLGTVEIEVIKPAKITLPASINSLLLINNSLSFPTDSFKHKVQKGLFKLDTTSTQLVVSQINSILNESPRFDTSILINDIYFREAKDLLRPIKWDDVNNLCAIHNSDALVSLEAFGIIDSIVQTTYYDGYEYTLYKTLALITNSMWRIYFVDEKKVLERRIQRDTVFIDAIHSKSDYLDAVTEPKAIKYLSEQIALNISTKVADRLAPYWLPVKRDFFNYGNDLMQQAAKFAYADNWRGAALIWKSLTDDENKRLAAAACHNMALVCEVEGKLDIALAWLEESVEKNDTYTSRNYAKQIVVRIAETEKLDKQFGVESKK